MGALSAAWRGFYKCIFLHPRWTLLEQYLSGPLAILINSTTSGERTVMGRPWGEVFRRRLYGRPQRVVSRAAFEPAWKCVRPAWIALLTSFSSSPSSPQPSSSPCSDLSLRKSLLHNALSSPLWAHTSFLALCGNGWFMTAQIITYLPCYLRLLVESWHIMGAPWLFLPFQS